VITRHQDCAPSHRSIKTVAFLQANVFDFIELSNWPSNLSDLNYSFNLGCSSAAMNR